MPTKTLTSQAGRGGLQKFFSNGGGSNTIFAIDDGLSSFGYHISGGGGDDDINGSDFTGRGVFDPADADPRTEFGDLLIGGDGSDTISGGLGNDTIYGGNLDGSDGGKGPNPVVTNTLIGEEGFVFLAASESYSGGNDVLFAGNDVTNFMFGDAQSVSGDATTTFTGGDDTLISGTGNDTMVGDLSSSGGGLTVTGGDDTFVFAPNNGVDNIVDFELAEFDEFGILIDAHDVIDLTAFGSSLDFAALDALWVGDTITFSAGNTLKLTGLDETQFHEEDFIFAVA